MFEAKTNLMFGGKGFQKGEAYDLTDDEQKNIGSYFKRLDKAPVEEKKEVPKKEEKVEETEEPKPKAKRR